MALKISISSDNGAVANYHRIYSISKDTSTITVSVRSYADATFRSKEMELDNLNESYTADQNTVNAGIQSNSTDEQKEAYAKATANLKRRAELARVMQYFMFSNQYRLPSDQNSETISWEQTYTDLINTQEDFKGAVEA